ncbi:glycoside hydrolase family 13 protein [Streptomyces zingiberis]|uniref:Glycoside hydrolase family 13 protein n=1 Tax=Streptomyces zingiberis TaxID=2053010 RepID=A0ABX1BTE5_9ACTN|nr:glycoside hydrolase family 13 protein [Streptomyces zingiberis]NJP99680.1 glycoside hydrolase family 13 protein [Streptomyces zingiberis]
MTTRAHTTARPDRPRTAPAAVRSPVRPGGRWWRGAVIYQIFVRSFADADGDGIGDLRGVRERLPYLARLGVDAVWLTPVYRSPQADAGYDVSDYREVDPLFGNLDELRALIHDLHARGLRIILDIVPNHTSEQHPWFRQALREGPGSPLRGRYWFRPGKGAHGEVPPNDWESVFGGPAWTRTTDPDGTPGAWYLHLFSPGQPDLNWQHPAVRDEFRSILRRWLDLGADGFRIDVAHGLVKEPGLPDIAPSEQARLLCTEYLPFFEQDGVHEIYRSWRQVLDEYPGPRIAVAEAWTPSVDRTALYLRPDELHQAFNFQFLRSAWDAGELRSVIDASLSAAAVVGATTTWVLSNHDVVRHTTRYAGGDPERGLRRARAALLLMLALPGSAYLYQGEELGLPQVTDLATLGGGDSASGGKGREGAREGCRVPLPWSGTEPPYGFGPEPGGPSWLPQPESWAGLSVEAQSGDPASTLELYRSALALRREHPALGAGERIRWLAAPDGVLAFLRTSADGPRRDGGGARAGTRASAQASARAGAAGDGPGHGGDGEAGAGDAVVCVLNTLGHPVDLPHPGGRPLLGSTPPAPASGGAGDGSHDGTGDGPDGPDGADGAGAVEPARAGSVRIPAESCVWWAI